MVSGEPAGGVGALGAVRGCRGASGVLRQSGDVEGVGAEGYYGV